MAAPRRKVEPLIERLLDGKVPKQIAVELGIGHEAVNYHLARFVKDSGCKTLVQAVAEYAATKVLARKKPPEGVD